MKNAQAHSVPRRKLGLQRETIAVLAPDSLRRAVGGGEAAPHGAIDANTIHPDMTILTTRF